MEPDEYALMAQVEAGHWWYKGLRGHVMAELDGRIGDGALVLDAGCGTGGTIATLSSRFPGARFIGLDFSALAISSARDKGSQPIVWGNVNALPVADHSFDAITSLDVIYHVGVDETKALRELLRALVPGGVALVNLPAFDWLRSSHDMAVHTARRYTTGRLRARAIEAGFEVVACGYRNSLLFPLMVIERLAQRVWRRTKPRSSVKRHWAPVNSLLSAVVLLENRLLELGVRFPVGGSVFAVLAKPSRRYHAA